MNSTLLKQKRMIFKYWGKLLEKYWRILRKRLGNVIRLVVFADWYLS